MVTQRKALCLHTAITITLANIKRNLGYNFLLSLSQVLFPAITIPYISRVLDTTGIGLVSQVDSFTMYMVVLAEAGISMYAIREVARSQGEQRRKLVHELLSLHIVSSTIVFVLYAIGMVYLWQAVHDIRLILLSAIFYIASSFSCEWYFIGTERFSYIALRSIIIRLIGVGAILACIKLPSHYAGYYFVIVATAMAVHLVNILLLMREHGFQFSIKNYPTHIKPISITFLISILYAIPVMLDNVLLGAVSAAAIVGLYALPVKLVRLSTNLLTDSMQVFYPHITALQSQSHSEKANKMEFNLNLILLLSIPMGMGLFLLAQPLAIWILGNQYASTGINLKWLSLFPVVKGLSLYYSNPGLLAHNGEKLLMKALLASSLFYVIIALWLGNMYADVGASMALIAGEIVLLLLTLLAFRKQVDNAPVFNLKAFIVAMLGAAFFIPVVFFIKQLTHSVMYICVGSILCCMLIYIPFFYYGMGIKPLKF